MPTPMLLLLRHQTMPHTFTHTYLLQAALDLAHQLCVQHRVFERPLGLVGIWGGIVREWLHTLLPADAADR